MNGARPAGFWIRVAAVVIDGVIIALARRSLAFAAKRAWGRSVEDSAMLEFAVAVFTLVFAGLYVILLHAAGGQTIGKLLVRARVVMVDGEPVSLGASLLRFVASIFSGVTLGFGYLMTGLRRDKRALHDLIAGTRVERVPARAPEPADPAEAVVPPVG